MLSAAVLRLLLQRPALLASHAINYAALAQQQTRLALRSALWRALALALAVAALLACLMLCGTALLMGVLMGQFHWIMLAVPGAALALALCAWWLALRPMPDAWGEIQRQYQADLQAMQRMHHSEAAAPNDAPLVP